MDVLDFFYKLMRLYHRNAAISIKTVIVSGLPHYNYLKMLYAVLSSS